MFRTMMKSKIHRAVTTEADLNYVGSITIDRDIMDAVDILENERVQVVNNNNGVRFETYAIPGPRKSGVICMNGAAARLAQPGDIVIIISYATMEDSAARKHQPVVALMNPDNTIQKLIRESSGMKTP